jgi:type III pantothenate kinase
MLLVVDIGNSNLTLGLARDGALLGTRRAETRASATPDEVELLLDGLVRLLDVDTATISAIAVAATVPALGSAVEAIADRRGIPCVVASAGTLPLAIHCDRPGEVGPDRLVNAYAVAHLHGTPAVVVDCGTATTFDAVDATGAFVGGAIAPGLELGLDALAERTARLPRVTLRTPERAIGRDTASAIQAGAVLGHQAMIGGLLARIRRELGAAAGIAPHEVHAVLTGGLAAGQWARGIEGIDAIDPDLTLKGLVLFHRAVTGEGEGPR